MYSKRAIEDLSLKSIKNFLKERYAINNTIINNASIETYDIKQQYGEKVFSFFNILLAATLISSFILYGMNSDGYLFQSRAKTFFLIFTLISIVLLLFTCFVFIKFYMLYLRQRVYRDINNAIVIILNNCKMFFHKKSKDKNHISIVTLNSFLDVLYLSYETKNKHLLYKKILAKEWRGIVIGFICALSSLILSISLMFVV